MQKVKQVLIKKQTQKITEAASLAELLKILKTTVKLAAPMLKAEGLEVRFSTVKDKEGNIWEAIYMREVPKPSKNVRESERESNENSRHY